MKKLVLGLMALVLFTGACHFEHNYTRKECDVIQVCDGVATVIDGCGFTWDFCAKGLEVGDVVDLKMHDNFTSANIEDDVIKKVVKNRGFFKNPLTKPLACGIIVIEIKKRGSNYEYCRLDFVRTFVCYNSDYSYL